MADFSVKFRAHQLGKDLESLSKEVEGELNQAIKDLSNATYANIVARAQSELNSTRADYIKDLSFEQIGENSYLISLTGDFANALEDGWSPYSLRDKLLKSKKTVQVGSRSGQSWVQEGKDGKKYAHVPFEHKPFSKAAQTGDLSAAIRKMKAHNKSGRKQKLTSIFKDEFGKPMQGKVARVESEIPELNNITKFQKVYTSESGKQSVQSLYMTFRTISENGKDWQHPGFAGLKAFIEAERFVEEQIDIIIDTIVK